MQIKKNIPNTITLGNLFCGCLALISTFEDNLVWAAYFVGIALILDFFDGFAARMLKVSSAIGKDLDSLADMVTFGVVPGMVMYKLIALVVMTPLLDPAGTVAWTTYPPITAELTNSWLPYVGLVITIFSCIRLAKFNNDTRQSDSFIGLPTPANAMVICSLPLILRFQPELSIVLLGDVWFFCFLSIVMSLLLVAEIPLFALKFKGFGWRDSQNRLRYVFLLLSVLLMIVLKFLAIPLIIILYILLSIVNNLFLKKKL